MSSDMTMDTIIPDPLDPGEEFTLPDLVEFDDTPEDPDAADSPDCTDEVEEAEDE